ncbi:MAG: hypothetical protein AAFO07_22095 [Bacteroidota bacterium]
MNNKNNSSKNAVWYLLFVLPLAIMAFTSATNATTAEEGTQEVVNYEDTDNESTYWQETGSLQDYLKEGF